eukprot:269021_1
MTTKGKFLVSNVENWFTNNVYNSQSVFKCKNDPQQFISSTCCYYTTHFILKYATQPIKTPMLTNHFHYDKNKDDNLFDYNIWDNFHDRLHSEVIHQIFHYRI